MVDEARDMLLEQALQAWGSDPAVDTAVGDVPGYLRAYYRRVATEDLPPAGQLAAIARAHAALALNRPQGRALVKVTESAVDIVTDDMQYLVDSVTT